LRWEVLEIAFVATSLGMGVLFWMLLRQIVKQILKVVVAAASSNTS